MYSVNEVPHGSVAARWYDSPGNDMVRRMVVYTSAGYEENTANISMHYPNTFDYIGLFSSALGVRHGGNNTNSPVYRNQDEKLNSRWRMDIYYTG